MRRLVALVALPVLLFAACGGDDDGGDGGSASGASNADSAFCDGAREIEARFNELDEEFNGDTIPTPEVFEEAAAAIEDLVPDAPDEIGDDLETVAGGVRRLAELLGEFDLSDPEVMNDPEALAQLEALGEELESIGSDVEGSTERVETYLRDECGIETEDPDTSGETDDPATDESTEE